MTRKEILSAASAAVLKDRQETYGPPEDSFSLIAEFWQAYLRRHKPGPLTSNDVAALLILLKIARISKSPAHMDNWCDAAGYAACGGELASLQVDTSVCGATSDGVAVRPDNSPLNRDELIQVSKIGHQLMGQTITKFTPEEQLTIEMAVLNPQEFNWGTYKRLSSMF